MQDSGRLNRDKKQQPSFLGTVPTAGYNPHREPQKWAKYDSSPSIPSVLVLYTNYCQSIHILELRQYYGVMKSKFLYSLIAGSRDGGEQ